MKKMKPSDRMWDLYLGYKGTSGLASERDVALACTIKAIKAYLDEKIPELEEEIKRLNFKLEQGE